MFDPIRTPSDVEAVKLGYRYDPDKAERPIQFIETFCRQSVGKWAGKPLTLLDWQKDFLRRLFGWVDGEGLRRFKEAYLEISKKNGKSTLVAAISLYMLIADGEAAPEISINAYDRSQAGIIFDECSRMIGASKALAKKLDIVTSAKLISYAAAHGKLRACSADVPSKDGGNISCIIFDELHRQRTDAMWNIYRYAGIAREQPLTISITTAGESRQSICYAQHRRAQQVQDGSLIDVGFLGVVYGPAADDLTPDIDAPSVWKAANPSMGVTFSEASFKADLETAKQSPEALVNFKRLRLNIWTQEVKRFFSQDLWNACPPRRPREEIYESGDVYFAGFDLSSTRDLTAFVTVAGNLKDGIDVFCQCWIPEEEAKRREVEQGIPYTTWAEQGYVTLTPGSRIDYDLVEAAIVEDHRVTDFKVVHADWYHANNVGKSLLAKNIPFKVIRQGFLSQNGPTQELERLIATGKVRHDNNPVLTWCISNAVAERDKAGCVMISKTKSSEKVDAAQALINALAGVIDGEGEAHSDIDEAPKIIWLGK